MVEGTSLLRRSRSTSFAALLLAVVTGGSLAWALSPGASARTARTDSSYTSWSPSPAPLPASLPNRGLSESALLYGSSCSSSNFCVAVGYVVSDRGDNFPLIETYDGTTWTPSVAPLPQGYGPPANGFLYSVSCATDGSCAAVGDYLDPAGYQQGLLETLSGGSWTATEGARATSSSGGLMNIRSVSCGATGQCMAAGDYASGSSYSPLVYELTSGAWHVEAAPPPPPDYQTGLVLSSVSCPDASDCVIVGSYDSDNSQGSVTSQGVILSMSAGTWSAEEAPLPPNADPAADSVGLQVLDSVDCTAPGTCVAGGGYVDTSGNGDALLLDLQSGSWSPSEAPVPAGEVNQWAIIQSISCPSAGACVADGSTLSSTGVQTGMLLTQSSSGWSSQSAPVPVTASARISGRGQQVKDKTTLDSVSCSGSGFCRAFGSYGKHGLIERFARRR